MWISGDWVDEHRQSFYASGMYDPRGAEGLTEIRKLYPDFTSEELVLAKTSLSRYAEVILRVAERLQAEGKSISNLE